MNTNDKRVEVLQRANYRDAKRYQKLRQWMIVEAKLYSQSDTPGKAGVILYGPTFDAAVDALPEPQELQ